MKKILIYSSLMVLAWTTLGQAVRLEKSFNESFLVATEEKVEINNKYGEIIVHTWYNDSVRIEVQVVSLGKSQESVNKEMDRVDISLRRIGSTILGETKFDQGKKSMFGDLMNQVGDAGKSIVGGSKTSVNYEIWMPADLSLVITNKYGDVYISSMSSSVSLDLSHGNLRGERIENDLILQHSFGKHSFDYVNDGNFTFRGVESKIDQGDKLSIESSSSEMKYGTIKQLQINSRNDKYDIAEVSDMIGEGSFTDLNVDRTLDQLRLDFSYGDIFLSSVAKEFQQIQLKGKSCDINMILNQASYIKTRIVGASDRMILPNSMLGMKKTDLEDQRISLEGHVGNTNTTVSDLDVNIDAGNLIISIKETDIFTNRD